MNKKSLWERCEISSNKDENSFVGIRIKDKDIHITFPMGYNLVEGEDRVVRKDILSLLSILKKFNKKKYSQESFSLSQQTTLEFPIVSYQHLILDYFSNGYYCAKEVDYSSANKGKINWKRTIQKKKPFCADGNAVYLDFIVKKNIINTNTILTRIHEYCVYESFIKLGWLYTDVLPMQPRIMFNQKMFISVLNEAISQTFNDNKKQLFMAMRNVVNSVNEGDTLSKECTYGTRSFEYVWERMIDYVFGESNKEVYFPKARWTLVGKTESIESSSLQPDTIIRLDDKVYIIDAKYYKYGITGNPSNLPASSSIQKQITYGEYLTSGKFKEIYGQAFSQDKIYNAFVMPFNKDKKQDDEYKFVGIATADWKDSDKQYENVVGLLLDTKHLMDNCYRQNGGEIEKISALIQEIFH
ncbi:MAG: LlaJI family restriction endonuclease [Lachnospiraceae bacterium]